MNPYFDPNKKHHRAKGFQNNYESFPGKRWHELLRWRYHAWRNGHPKPPSAPIPQVPPELGFIHANALAGASMQPAFTWVGHITMLAQFSGLNVITDPVFSDEARAGHIVGIVLQISVLYRYRASPPGDHDRQLLRRSPVGDDF